LSILLALIVCLLWLLRCASVVARGFALLRHCNAGRGFVTLKLTLRKSDRRER
jgi:hypothetical protein